ncbi:MAG: GspE/PulE family protein, partial [Candidatus Omnitrophica bacterium]|nr:GspE/PulE family protein [Candidatus Omnitrophota bacterium]MBU1924880.1 GspE/PulE family protein [Candidatus Omnitrophota bacterium]
MRSLEDVLMEEGLITHEQLKEARIKQVGAKIPIQDVVLEMGFVEEEKLLNAVSRAYQLPVTDLEKETIDTSWTKAVPYELLKKHGVFPIRKEADALILAMSNPLDIVAEDAIRDKAKIRIRPVLSSKSKIAQAIETYYEAHETLYDLLKHIVSEEHVEFITDDTSGAGYIEVAKDTQIPVMRLVNIMFGDAVKSRASDIHIEPQEGNFRVRYRIDGELRDIMKLPFTLQPALVNRIKVLANLDIAEKRKTQDGRMKASINGKKIDIRVSIIPVYHGEKAVLRILNPEEAIFDLERLGVDAAGMSMLRDAFSKSHGFILVTGPTGSGKTTTLYAVLDCIKGENTNIITIEDPIEYLTEGINQIQVNPAKNITFANGLRSILRQDPNVILVGEIRDKETADIAFRASLTGHLILSTVHTNNAVATITRLRDLGLEAYIIASSLNIIIAQRLVKRVCPDCRIEYAPDQELRDKFRQQLEDLKIDKFYKGKGCKKCDFSGWFGRKAIVEILKVDEKIKALITDNAAED